MTVVTRAMVETLVWAESKDEAKPEAKAEAKAEAKVDKTDGAGGDTNEQASHSLPARAQERVVGVRVKLADGSVREYRCGKEVILCAGAINSPKLLMLSGVGPAAVLDRANVKLRVDVPGVGKGLRDNTSTGILFKVRVGGKDNETRIGRDRNETETRLRRD